MTRFFQLFSFGIIVVFAFLLCGCGPTLIPFDEHVPAQALTYVGAPPIEDARVRFREIFCELLKTKRQQFGLAMGCDAFLWRLNDEPKVNAKRTNLPMHDLNLIILIVPGAFSDCIGEIGEPYQEGVERLRQNGYRIDNIHVSGLSSSAFNADIIAEAVDRLEMAPSQRLILLGYSKGTTDILHFLVTYPDLAQRVNAVLSVAGSVNGSPLADRYSKSVYDNWLISLIPGKCLPSDRGVLDSLSRTQQFQWLATHPLPGHVQYFSLAAFARYADVQLNLRPTYKLLKKIHPLNDGQLLFIDQIIPGSALLGYVNADHWTVAIPVEEIFSDRDLALKDRNRKLRGLLFEAMILFLAESMSSL